MSGQPLSSVVDASGAILDFLSGQGSLVGMERFTKRHRQMLNALLGAAFTTSPSDSTLRLLLAQLDVDGCEHLLRDWMAAQRGLAEEFDNLVWNGKTLRGSIDETASGAATFIARVSPYSRSLGVAIAQMTYATDASSEIKGWRRLLAGVDLEGVLVQADALHANRPFPLPRPARSRLFDRSKHSRRRGF